ncbi:hypothetical protein BDE02_02G071200 [Populus trichocarpa]|nr:hypothetical protein BDE02_02G071200 [Populus trichocarpa]
MGAAALPGGADVYLQRFFFCFFRFGLNRFFWNRCYCRSKEVAKRAALDGLEDSQIRVFGLLIRPSFALAVLSKDELREELELNPDLPAVLLMEGGEGMGPIKKTAFILLLTNLIWKR